MTQRLDYFRYSPLIAQKFMEFSQQLKDRPHLVDIAELVQLRASQLNGCGFCVDMHVKQAKIRGERELRLHHVAVWRDSPLFSPRERAALEWTEALTRLAPEGVPDALYSQVREHLSELELSDLSFQIVAINGWNRMNLAFKAVPGSADALFGLDKANLG